LTTLEATWSARVDLLPGERWWGGVVQDGALMPLGAKPYTRDLRTNLAGNQGAPLLVSDQGRYIWGDDAFAFSFEGDEVVLESDGPRARLAEGFNDLRGAFRTACERHFPPSGSMPGPVAFVAPQFNTWMEMGYEPTQDAVLAYAQAILDHGFPPGVLILDDGWSLSYGDWNFHPGRFPRPLQMVRTLQDMGFSLMLWVVPFVSPDTAAARSLALADCLVRDADGEVAIRKWWNGHSAILDLTHPEACRRMYAQLDLLVEKFGVAGFKMDGGDPEQYLPDDRTYAPTSPVGQCEAWAALGLRYRLSECRACWRLGGQPTIQRLRDKHHVWGRDGLGDLIPNGLAQGLAGYPFVCPDMVGGGDIGTSFRTEVDQELFVRTAQCSALFPMVQFSAAPWRTLDAEHLGYVQDAIRLRQRLVPEILALAKHAANSGEPMMRHLEYSYPGHGYAHVQDQFLLGDDLLVAPVLERGALSRTVVFPPGDWYAEGGTCYEGPGVRVVPASLGRLPWFRRNADASPE